MRLDVTSIEAVAKLIDALTTQSDSKMIVIQTDLEQAYKPADKRGFIVNVYNAEDVYIEKWDITKSEED